MFYSPWEESGNGTFLTSEISLKEKSNPIFTGTISKNGNGSFGVSLRDKKTKLLYRGYTGWCPDLETAKRLIQLFVKEVILDHIQPLEGAFI